MRVLNALHWDYHDFKGNPPETSVADRAELTGLTPGEVGAALGHFEPSRMSFVELQRLGFDFSDRPFDTYTSAAKVDFPDRPMIYLIPQNIYSRPARIRSALSLNRPSSAPQKTLNLA